MGGGWQGDTGVGSMEKEGHEKCKSVTNELSFT